MELIHTQSLKNKSLRKYGSIFTQPSISTNHQVCVRNIINYTQSKKITFHLDLEENRHEIDASHAKHHL